MQKDQPPFPYGVNRATLHEKGRRWDFFLGLQLFKGMRKGPVLYLRDIVPVTRNGGCQGDSPRRIRGGGGAGGDGAGGFRGAECAHANFKFNPGGSSVFHGVVRDARRDPTKY